MKNILFMVGGPDFHPVAAQAGLIAQWLGDGFDCRLIPGQDAFQQLSFADLLVVMGLYWPGMQDAWAGSMNYTPLSSSSEKHLDAFVRRGGPVVCHHGGIASYPESSVFAHACGWAWVWGETTHSPFGTWTTRMLPSTHPVVDSVAEFTLEDEIYYKVKVLDPLATQVHGVADFEDAEHPMISTRQRSPASGRRVYLANGHDLRTFSGDAVGPRGGFRRLWVNSIQWAMGQD